MKQRHLFLPLLWICLNFTCTNAQSDDRIPIDTMLFDSSDPYYGYYLAVPPVEVPIKGVLLLFPGFTQQPEAIFKDSNLHKIARAKGLLTIGYAGRIRLTVDSFLKERLSSLLKHVVEQYELPDIPFYFGGFSAGGIISLRLAELCKEFPDQFPVNARAVFMADSPVDLYTSFAHMQEYIQQNYSEIAVQEARFVERMYRQLYNTTPAENPTFFKTLTPFAMNKDLGTNEQFLKGVAVRAYHDVDIAWRLKNRNQSVRQCNYVMTSELINRLLLMGNTEAEFIQTFQTGYRSNGDRHPHSWSIIDEETCIEWLLSLN